MKRTLLINKENGKEVNLLDYRYTMLWNLDKQGYSLFQNGSGLNDNYMYRDGELYRTNVLETTETNMTYELIQDNSIDEKYLAGDRLPIEYNKTNDSIYLGTSSTIITNIKMVKKVDFKDLKEEVKKIKALRKKSVSIKFMFKGLKNIEVFVKENEEYYNSIYSNLQTRYNEIIECIDVILARGLHSGLTNDCKVKYMIEKKWEYESLEREYRKVTLLLYELKNIKEDMLEHICNSNMEDLGKVVINFNGLV